MATEAQTDADDLLWDDDAFIRRVKEYAARQGRSAREVCLAAGLSDEYLARYASRAGRRTEAIARLARELDVRLIDLIDPQDSVEHLARLGFVIEFATHLLAGLATSRRLPGTIDPRRLAAEVLRAVSEKR